MACSSGWVTWLHRMTLNQDPTETVLLVLDHVGLLDGVAVRGVVGSRSHGAGALRPSTRMCCGVFLVDARLDWLQF